MGQSPAEIGAPATCTLSTPVSCFRFSTRGLRTRTTRRPFSRTHPRTWRSEEHTSELQSHSDLVCRLLLEKKKKKLRIICSTVVKYTIHGMTTQTDINSS